MRILLIILLVIIGVFLAVQSRAMGWYPASCCNDRDCWPVPAEDVTVADGKYVVAWGGQTIEFYEANPSPDGQYHICTAPAGDTQGAIRRLQSSSWKKYEDTTMPTSNACFWAPGGM